MLKIAQLQAQPPEAILSKHLPESSGYAGNHVIDLAINPRDFRPDLPDLTYVLEVDSRRRVEIAGSPDLQVDALTVTCWMRLVGQGNCVLVRKEKAEGGGGLEVSVSSERFLFMAGQVGGGFGGFHSNTPCTPGIWYHLAVTFAPGTEAPTRQIFVNGILDSSSSLGAEHTVKSNQALTFGGGHGRGVAQIDDIRIWNHARSEAQIQRDMYEAIKGDEVGLEGAWKAGTGEHEQLQDLSPHGRHGIFQGAELVPATRPRFPPRPDPALLLIEKYRLSIFPGRVGQGRVVKTFSLLPGERTKISVSAFTKTEQERKEASAILDSHTDESAQDFQNSVEAEQTAKTDVKGHVEAYAELSGEATWGAATVRGKAGMKASVDASRDDFSKNVSNALQKHAAKASRKRDVQINTSYEVKEETSTQTATEREVENINLSRTLNFVFRQMTQEFISLLHLADVRIGAVRTLGEPPELVPVSELDDLLERYIKEERRAPLRKDILEALRSVRDGDGALHEDFIKPLGEHGPEAEIWTVNRKLRTAIGDEPGDEENQVRGVIVGVERNVMRMEAVTVEASLGEENALDDYSMGLQLQAVREQELRNDLMAAERDRRRLIQRIVESKDREAAELFWRANQPTLGDLMSAVVDVGRGVLTNASGGDGVPVAARSRSRTSARSATG